MNANYKILDTGLTVITDPIDIKSTSIGVWVGAGSSKETLDQCGIAHMLEHMAFKGTKNRNAEKIAREIEDVGGDINAYTSKEVTAYYLKVLHENTELGVDILSDIIKNSTLPKDEIERERGVIISEIGQSFDAPDDRVFENFTSTAFKGQSIGRPILGTKETVSNFKQSDLASFFLKHYAPENMVVVASGNVKSEWFYENVEEKFSGIKHNYQLSKVEAEWKSGFSGEDRELEQTQLVLGIEGLNNIDVDRYSLRALAIILGGGMSSRLFQEIREKRGLCYSIFAFTQMQISSGVFGFYAGTSPEDGNNLLDASLNELKKIKNSITETELLRAKAQMRSGFIMGQESNSSRAEYLAKSMINFRKLITTKEVLEEIDNISISSIQNVIDRLFSSAEPVLSVIGPNASSYENLDIMSLLQ
jgi:predicted Zn-dependent peptidase